VHEVAELSSFSLGSEPPGGTLMVMASKLKSLDSGLFTRQCVACGYDGALLQDGQAERCARCGCDLRVRPARSYAEMEGFISSEMSAGISDHQTINTYRLLHRWLVFLFFAMLLIIAIGYLTVAAFPP